MPIATDTIHAPTLTITPFSKEKGETPHEGWGAFVEGCDLNDLPEAVFKELEEAIYTYEVVVLKGQKGLLPEKQQELGVRFDPKTPAKLGHMEETRKVTTVLSKARTDAKPTIAKAPLVNLNGSGVFSNHFGLAGPITLEGLTHKTFHKDPLSAEDTENGQVRFQRWHIDAPFFQNYCAKVTSIWAHTLPAATPTVNLRWDDGSNQTMQAPPGRTAFFSPVALYESLTPAQKAWVDNSLVEYAPSPYQWLGGAKADPLGLRMLDEGKEISKENWGDMVDADPAGAQTIPMVWINPVTGKRALQVHAIIAYRLHYRESPDAEFKIIEDLATVRQMLDDLQRPFITPAHVLFPATEEGDVLFFYNRGVRHSAVEFPAKMGDRLLHQLQLISRDPPFAPEPITGLPYRAMVAASA